MGTPKFGKLFQVFGFTLEVFSALISFLGELLKCNCCGALVMSGWTRFKSGLLIESKESVSLPLPRLNSVRNCVV